MTEQYKTEFVYEFKIPFEYACRGEMVTAKKITIKSPNNMVKMFTSEIDKQRLMAARIWQQNINTNENDIQANNTQNVDNGEQEIDNDSIIEFIGSGGGDLNACFEALRNILKSGNEQYPVAVLDDETKVTSPLFDKFSYIDTRNILGGYIKNFLRSSGLI